MKVAVSATAPSLDAQLDPRFGRSPYILIVDTDTMEYKVIENPNVFAAGGAGIQTAQMVANEGVEAVLTGACGPNAYRTLEVAGIKVYVGVSGTVRSVVEAFREGRLSPTSGPSVGPHFGMGGGGFGFGGFGGGGRGMGMGRGGWAAGPGFPQMSGAGIGVPPEQNELSFLRNALKNLEAQLDAVRKRIEELEKKEEEGEK